MSSNKEGTATNNKQLKHHHMLEVIGIIPMANTCTHMD